MYRDEPLFFVGRRSELDSLALLSGEKTSYRARDCCCLAVARGYPREGGNGLHLVTKDRSTCLQRILYEVVPGGSNRRAEMVSTNITIVVRVTRAITSAVQDSKGDWSDGKRPTLLVFQRRREFADEERPDTDLLMEPAVKRGSRSTFCCIRRVDYSKAFVFYTPNIWRRMT